MGALVILACWLLNVVSSLVVAHGLLIVVASHCRSRGLSSCGTLAELPCGVWNLSSETRDQTRVSSALADEFLNHWATREVIPSLQFFCLHFFEMLTVST